MRTVTNDYLAQVQSSARQFDFKVKVYGNSADGDEIPLADIISIDIVRSISDQLQTGACMSAKLTLQTKATTLFGGRLKKVEVYCRCKSPVTAWEQLGTFYVDESVTKSGVTAVTAYDKTARLDKKTSWIDTGKAQAPTFPCKMQAVLNYLCARAGMTTDFVCEDITITNAPDGYTARELISYIAASHGANAYVAPNEVLKITPYTQANKTVEHDRCYAMDISGGDYTVKGILFDRGGDNKIYIDGTASEYDEDADGIVSAYNPFATVGIAEYAWNKLGGLKYSAASIEMPAENILEVGDVFTVKDADGTEKKAIVMEQSLSVSGSGGFVERISCSAESKAQTRDANNRSEKIEKTVSNAGSGVGRAAEYDKTSEYFNDYTNNVAGVKGKQSYATARGFGTSALAEASSAEGYGGSIDAKSFAAHTEGYNGIITSSQYAHIEGQSCEISGCDAGHAEGYTNKITGGMGNHVEGGENVNNGTYAHVEGHLNKITNTARGAHAEGTNTEASADGAHAEGMNTAANSESAHAEGNGSTASGSGAHAEGMSTTASGGFSHAEGMGSTATGAFSHAGGTSCTATGDGSFAGGSNSQTKQFADFAYGDSVITDSDSDNTATAAFGRYNDPTGHIFSVGNGNSGARSNAFAVDADGTIHCTRIEGAEVGGKVDISASEEVSTAMLTVTKDDDTGAVTLAANVNISRDAGNSLFVGGDGGLYADPRALVQYYYTDEITFREGEFDIAYHVSGVAAKSTFAVTEDDSGRITEIKQKLYGDTGRSIKVNYE